MLTSALYQQSICFSGGANALVWRLPVLFRVAIGFLGLLLP